jgi:hypothetical protein
MPVTPLSVVSVETFEVLYGVRFKINVFKL